MNFNFESLIWGYVCISFGCIGWLDFLEYVDKYDIGVFWCEFLF